MGGLSGREEIQRKVGREGHLGVMGKIRAFFEECEEDQERV